MFGLFDAEPGWFGEGGVEKRAFCFARERGGEAVNEGGLGDVLEVRVFRSKGRRRTEPEMGRFAQSALGDEASGGGEQQNNNGGRIKFDIPLDSSAQAVSLISYPTVSPTPGSCHINTPAATTTTRSSTP